MAKNWAALGGEKGKKVDTSRVGRALTLGKLATRFTGSMIRAGLGGKRDDGLEAMAAAALKNAHKIADALGEMKGAAMKVGQMLSADPDLVDPAFAERLATLQSEAPPMDYATVAAQIESQLDKPIDAAFRFFNPEPIGSASIGQVHRATLFDGREVAVKVQYPGIAGSIDSDLRNLGSLLAVGRVFVTKERAAEFVAEARHAILTEADYRREGE
ncbi:MAG: AarF/ABC1/UbiB kinase family protein, partial [Myxococcales bacterium]|nr:AarF/ABC1/UbiB kinase family protein [Myxococcales bacterium]